MKLRPGEPEIYCSTFCNNGHRMTDGQPVGHQCETIPPRALRAERAGDFEAAHKLLEYHRYGLRAPPPDKEKGY